MTQAKPSNWVTAVSEIASDGIYIRGYPMSELVGNLPFSAVTYLLIRGALPTPGQTRMMDVILSSILDFALQKSGTIAARAVVSVNPQMTAGVAAALLAAGEHAVSPEDTGRFIQTSYANWKACSQTMDSAAAALVEDIRANRRRIPGFGHQIFRGVDPRAERLKGIAQEQGIWGEVNEWYEAILHAFRIAAIKPDLVMNDVGMLAGIMVQMGFTPQEMCGISLLSTMPGVIAHISEEIQSGVRNRIVPDSHVEYAQQRRDFEADLRAAGW
jgi:citrate synthase